MNRVLRQEGHQIKTRGNIQKNVFYFLQMCFALLFIWACHSVEEEGEEEEGEEGTGDNSNSTAKFKIQFMNSSPAF